MFREVLFKSFSLQLFVMWIGGAEAVCLGVVSCSCEANPSGLVVNCRNQNLDHVPAFASDNADQIYYELTLDTNAIRTIEANAFAGIRIRRLVLTNNRLTNIADDAFSGLERDLSELALQIDRSTAFPTVALSKLTMMKSLEIVGYGYEALPAGALTSLSSLMMLTLTSGALRLLTPEDFATQKSQLTFLNLHSNLFEEIPTAAISVLTNLSVLRLDLNRLFTIGSAAFDGASSLAILNLARNPVTDMELDAFSGLDSTLRNLSLQQCQLTNEHLKAIIRLKSLVYLDISDNYFANIEDILKNMKFLQVLKASRNRITGLKGSTYSLSNSLLVLHLDDNPLVNVASDAFSGLTHLQELYLDGAQRLLLDAYSFTSQGSSLKLLSMRSTNLPSSPWPAVSVLGALKTLWMSSCELTEVPDFTLSRMSGLENLDLNNNAISRLTQKSLAGLSTSLVRLYLSGNKLQTLDECVFYEFQKLDILQLQLNNNPLECDCALKWLHDLLRPYKTNPATQFRVMSLQWKCANLNGKQFTTLTDANFSNCPSVNQSSTQCQHLEYTTPSMPPTSTPNQSTKLVLTLTDVTHDSLLVTWTTPPSAVAIEFNLEYVINDQKTRLPPLPSDANQYSLTGLTPDAQYIVCLEMVTSGFPITTCTNATTADGPQSNNMFAVIIGTSLAGGLVLVCVTVVIIVVVVVYLRKLQQQQLKPSQLVRSPTVGRQSKRYRKTKDCDTTLTVESCDDPDDALVHTLVAMTDEEKDRLVNLLTSSMGSLDDLDRASSFRYVGARYGRIDAVTPSTSSIRDRHEYDEIPDSYYDEIKCEDEEVAAEETEGEATLVGETQAINKFSK